MNSILSVSELRTGVLRLGLSAGLIMLAGCATAPSDDTRRLLASVPAASLAKVESTAASGQAVAAAEAYLALAKTSQAPARQALELRAAEAFYQAGQSQRALRTLSAIDSTRLTAGVRNFERLLAGRIALQASLPERALAELNRLSNYGLPPENRIERLGLMAAAYRQSGDPVQAAQKLDEIDRQLDNPGRRLDNQVSLLLTLSAMKPSSLQKVKSQGSGRMRAWAGLAELLAENGSADAALLARFRSLRSRHGALPINDELPRAYYATLAGNYAPGTDAWALLPHSGRFSNAGMAVRKGLRHADALNSSGRRPVIKETNSASNVKTAYERATASGADLIIGPLQKPAVNALSEGQRLPVPTLALNQNTNGRALPDQFYQFALAPEDEAISAANHAWASELRSVLLIYPQGPWGSRLASAFREHWRALGGDVAGEVVYGSTDASMGTAIDTLLAPGKGDLIFMVATGQDARQLWRPLQGANIRNLPALATSHVYNGSNDDARALAGLYFVDIPWLLDPNSRPVRAMQRPPLVAEASNATLTRLQAMGADSYRLAPRSRVMAKNSGHFFPGVSGGLSFDGTGRVQRILPLGRFEASGPVPVERIKGPRGERKSVHSKTGAKTGDVQLASR